MVADSFGALETRPALVFCTGPRCAGAFGLRARGRTYGSRLILIGPDGRGEMIVPHERTHAEVHRSLRRSDLRDRRPPSWVDEGLASHLAGDTRLDIPPNARDADWIRTARSFRDRGRLHPAQDRRASCGAAARLVAEIEDIHGRGGLRDLVIAVEAGASFDAEYARKGRAAAACAAPPP